MPVNVDTKDIDAVCAEADRIYRALYRDADPQFMSWACGWFHRIFDGRYRDYMPIDVLYHDREHTMQGLLCLLRLLHGRHHAGIEPRLPRRTFELGMLGILLHDTGYLKRAADTAGTGAKYTLVHVERSREFAATFLEEQGYSPQDIDAVRNMIRCTSMEISPAQVAFASPAEHAVGCALASADLLGQMSAPDYIDRLPHLYAEFKESFDFYGEPARRLYYDSVRALIANTPVFWRSCVGPRLEDDCEGAYRCLNDPYPDGRNAYLERIEANVATAARISQTN